MCEKYKPIVVQVAGCAGIRTFKTQSFTIRALVVCLQRYCGEFQIVSVRYGDYDGPSEWSKTAAQMPTELPTETSETKTQLLQNHNYRDAMNIYYCQCAANGTYPSKAPFRGVALDAPPEKFKFGEIKHPLFVWDVENIYTPKSDVLRYYDGLRISKYLNGEHVNGYLLNTSRNNKEEAHETNVV